MKVSYPTANNVDWSSLSQQINKRIYDCLFQHASHLRGVSAVRWWGAKLGFLRRRRPPPRPWWRRRPFSPRAATRPRRREPTLSRRQQWLRKRSSPPSSLRTPRSSLTSLETLSSTTGLTRICPGSWTGWICQTTLSTAWCLPTLISIVKALRMVSTLM